MENNQLYRDALTMATRLYLESDDTFAPETLEVMARWRLIVDANLKRAERGLHPTIAASIAPWMPPPLNDIERQWLDAQMAADKKAEGYRHRAEAQAMKDQIKAGDAEWKP